MLCEHGNTTPCVECDIEPLKAENESLRRDISALVEALDSAKNLIANHSGEMLPDEYAGDQIEQIDAALAACRKQGGCK